MELYNQYFGEITYEKEDQLYFPNGLFGFEEETLFLLLPFSKDEDTLFCLQSINTPNLSFILMNPFSVIDYGFDVSKGDLADLGCPQREDIAIYVICVVKEPFTHSTVNLKCPILINKGVKKGKQIILESDYYTFRHPLNTLQEGGN